jgi:hypothetical protein
MSLRIFANVFEIITVIASRLSNHCLSKQIMCTIFISHIGADIVYFAESLQEYFIIRYPSSSTEGNTALYIIQKLHPR